ncbi:MAG: NAD-dependent epimerase/dehydratase family protein [Verrucomicrobiota bacterium]
MNFLGKRLVVFGAGYVGAEVARQGIVRGLRVTALTRNADKARALAAAGVETIVADLADDDWHARIAGGADFVLNSVSSGGGGLDGYQRSYVQGMQSVLAWAERSGGPSGTLIYTGSTSVYPQDGGPVVTEAMAVGGNEKADLLVATEALAARWPGRRWVLRLAGIYGPGRHHLLDQLRAGAADLGGRGDHRLNLIHRDDICTAIWAGFGTSPGAAGEIFNLADDYAATKVEVVTWLAAQLGVPVPSFTGEGVPGRRAVMPDRVIASEKIRRTLGWHPVFPTFREGYAAILLLNLA